MFLFIFIGTSKENILKQQSIECHSLEHINGKLILKMVHIIFLMTWLILKTLIEA